MNQSNVYAIEVKDLTVTYDAEPVLWEANVKFKKNKITAIIGPNGAGKSTLLKAMLNFISPIAGDVIFNVTHHKSNSYKKVKKDIAYVPQNRTVDWDFPATVFDVVMMGRYGMKKFYKRINKEDKEVVKESLRKVDMLDFSDRQINQLSGGQKQRVFLARALAEEGDIYILDEPLAGVDIKTERIIMKLLKELVLMNKTVMVVHHDLQTVEEYFDEVVFLNRKIIDFGPVSEKFTEANIERAYRKDNPQPNEGDSTNV